MKNHYRIRRTAAPITVNATWNKPDWQDIDPIDIHMRMGAEEQYQPRTRAKMAWDKDRIYVIFNVDDQYVRAVATQYFGSVWKDSCVEFFFTPDREVSSGYFNLETNCIGTILMCHQQERDRNRVPLKISDLNNIHIATSLPYGQTINPELATPFSWTLEYSLPWPMLGKYTPVQAPAPGVIWRGNFYKCAEENSRPHWFTWADIPLPEPDFHQPDYFGYLEFVD